MYDFVELRLLIIRKYDNLTKFCESTGINYAALAHTMRSGKAMSAATIERLADALEIPEAEYGKYFFAKRDVKINAD